MMGDDAKRFSRLLSAAPGLGLVAALMIAVALPSAAQKLEVFPSKPLRIIVPFPPGGGADILARLVSQQMTESMGQPVIVENRGGAGSMIGTEAVLKAPADGYTLLIAVTAFVINPTLYRKVNYDPLRDFTPASLGIRFPYLLVVHPSLPVKSVKELIALAKAHPGKITYASSGTGLSNHLAGEMFRDEAGIDIVHVPYRGGAEAVTAIVSGETSVSFLPLATALPQTRQGRLRALAVSTAKRVPSLPEYPTLAEAGVPGFEFGTWYGVMAPAKTPREIIAVLQAATVASLRNPEVLRRLNDLGYITVGDTPEVFQAYVKSEVERLGKLIRAYKLAVDG
jgi:tripartite-type tricarboxylate transporter receptor subunit TctC